MCTTDYFTWFYDSAVPAEYVAGVQVCHDGDHAGQMGTLYSGLKNFEEGEDVPGNKTGVWYCARCAKAQQYLDTICGGDVSTGPGEVAEQLADHEDWDYGGYPGLLLGVWAGNGWRSCSGKPVSFDQVAMFTTEAIVHHESGRSDGGMEIVNGIACHTYWVHKFYPFFGAATADKLRDVEEIAKGVWRPNSTCDCEWGNCGSFNEHTHNTLVQVLNQQRLTER